MVLEPVLEPFTFYLTLENINEKSTLILTNTND